MNTPTTSSTATQSTPTPAMPGSAAADRLRSAGVSAVHTADQPAFGRELAGFNTHLEHHPAAVVAAHSVDDVVTAVRVAAELDLPVNVIGHGHGALTAIEDGIAITTRHLAAVEVDPADRTARVSAGTPWSAVLDAAAPHGLAPLCGSAPHVGVIGYLMGGGLGPVARTYGFAADHVRSLQVVTADGRLLTCDAEHEPDLFWVLRGGKGGLAVVIEATIYLLPLTTVQGGGIFWAAEHASAVLHAFSTWTQSLPEQVTPSLALLRLPPAPELPEPLRGRFVVHLRVAVVGDPGETDELLAPLRAVAPPLLDTVTTLPYAAIGTIHADPVQPMPVVEGGILLRAFSAEAADALLSVAGPDVPAPLAAVELRLLGGAVSRPPTVPNATGGRQAAYSLHVVGAPVPELLTGAVPAAIGAVFDALAPWGTGGSAINFFGAANDMSRIRASWPAEVTERLDAVRDAYDPAGRFPHPARRQPH
jgi:hypothetical protein